MADGAPDSSLLVSDDVFIRHICECMLQGLLYLHSFLEVTIMRGDIGASNDTLPST